MASELTQFGLNISHKYDKNLVYFLRRFEWRSPPQLFTSWVSSYYSRLRRTNSTLTFPSVDVLINAVPPAKRSFIPYMRASGNYDSLRCTKYIYDHSNANETKLVAWLVYRAKSSYMNPNIPLSTTNYAEAVNFINQTSRLLDIENMASHLWFHNLLEEINYSEGQKFAFMLTRCSSYYQRKQHKAIIKLTRHCLANGLEVEDVWDTFEFPMYGQAESFNNAVSDEAIKTLLPAIFSKQKKLFNFLTECPQSYLNELAEKYIDVANMLGIRGDGQSTRARKMTVVLEWKNLVLLDLLDTDISFGDGVILDNLSIPKQVKSQHLEIDI